MTSTADYQVMPPLSAEEYEALRADIRERGILVPVVRDQHGNLLDGHHRVQIAAELGIDYPHEVRQVDGHEQARDVAYALNLARRHLNREQRRELITREIEQRPDDSDRAIGRRLGCDHKTVGSVRRELRGEIPHLKPEPTPATDLEVAELLVDAIGKRYDSAQTDDERHRWALPLQLSDEILRWGAADAPSIVWFSAVAQRMYGAAVDVGVWEFMAPWMASVAGKVLEECAEVREKRGAEDWRLPGELLAEITVALWSADIGRDLRLTMFRSMEGQIAMAMAECSVWWPIPKGDVVVARAAEVLAHVSGLDGDA